MDGRRLQHQIAVGFHGRVLHGQAGSIAGQLCNATARCLVAAQWRRIEAIAGNSHAAAVGDADDLKGDVVLLTQARRLHLQNAQKVLPDIARPDEGGADRSRHLCTFVSVVDVISIGSAKDHRRILF